LGSRANAQEQCVFEHVFCSTKAGHAMSESANRQSDSTRGSDKQKPVSRDRGGDSSADKSKAGQQAQKDAAVTQPPVPGEPSGGE